MTPDQDKALKGLFSRYGHPSTEADIRISGYLLHPDDLDTTARVKDYDQTAERTIQELEEKIRQLKVYRIALAERYNYLATAPTAPIVRLTRRKTYEGKVYYDLITYNQNLLDGQEVKTSSTTFPGKERHKAIAAYNDYVQAHPGIAAEMDIEKRSWER